MKKIISFLSLFSLLLTPFAGAEEITYPSIDENTHFNRGKLVGNENNLIERARRFERNKNWGLALGATALGIAALVLVGQNHK